MWGWPLGCQNSPKLPPKLSKYLLVTFSPLSLLTEASPDLLVLDPHTGLTSLFTVFTFKWKIYSHVHAPSCNLCRQVDMSFMSFMSILTS